MTLRRQNALNLERRRTTFQQVTRLENVVGKKPALPALRYCRAAAMRGLRDMMGVNALGSVFQFDQPGGRLQVTAGAASCAACAANC
jgi:hypothetical protein